MRIAAEALLIAIVAVAFGLTANAFYEDGLSLGRDYFEKLRDPPPDDGPGGSVGATVDTERRGVERITRRPTRAARTPEDDDPPPASDVTVKGYTGKAAEAAQRLLDRNIQVISHDDVVALYHDELFEYEAYTFVDARNEDKFKAGHIPTAYVFDHYYMDRYVNDVVPACQGVAEVIVYCYGEECTDSEIAAQHLVDLGVDRNILKVYVGGVKQWKAAGLPLEKGERGSGGPDRAGDVGGGEDRWLRRRRRGRRGRSVSSPGWCSAGCSSTSARGRSRARSTSSR